MAKPRKRQRYRRWSANDLAELVRRYPHERTAAIARDLDRDERAVYAKAAVLGLSKHPAFRAELRAAHNESLMNAGAPYRFRPGNVPHQAGKKGWDAGGRSHETRFKKGQRPHTWRPIGTERICFDGYLQRKVSDTGYPPRDWKGVHVLNWEAVHGPVPDGHALTFRDGNRQNCAIENLELVSRVELMRRNSYHTRYPKEIGQAIQLRGALVRKINRLERQREDRNQ
jgi:hypothetical protein